MAERVLFFLGLRFSLFTQSGVGSFFDPIGGTSIHIFVYPGFFHILSLVIVIPISDTPIELFLEFVCELL